MDDMELFKMAGFSTTGVAIVLLLYRVLQSVKGKRIVSSCCGRKLDVGVNVETMTPKEIVIENPMGLPKNPT